MTLADDIKRLQRIADLEWVAIDRDDALRTINQLVELVGEMHKAIAPIYLEPRLLMYNMDNFDEAYAKAAPIAALAKGE